MKLSRKSFFRHFLIIFFSLFVSFPAFSVSGKLKPDSVGIEIIWDGSAWKDSSDNPIEWKNDSDNSVTEDDEIVGSAEDDVVAFCTINGPITLTLEADLTLSTLFVFGANICTVNLNGYQLNVTDTLFLGSSWDNAGDIDNGLIANNNNDGREGSILGNLTVEGSGSVTIKDMNTSTWGYFDYEPDVFGKKNEQEEIVSVNSILNIKSNFSVSSWITGSTSTNGNTTGATIPTLTTSEDVQITIDNIISEPGHEILTDELVKDLINSDAEVSFPFIWTGSVNQNWDEPGNWSTSVVPTETAYIPKTENGKYPVISSAVSLAKIIFLDSEESNIMIKTSGSLTVSECNFNENSNIIMDGTFEINSTDTLDFGKNFKTSFSARLITNGDVNITGKFLLELVQAKNLNIAENSVLECKKLEVKKLSNSKNSTVVSESVIASEISNEGSLLLKIAVVNVFSNTETGILTAENVNDVTEGKIIIKKEYSNAGSVTVNSKIEFSGNELSSGNMQLGKNTSEYAQIVVNVSEDKRVGFGGQSKIVKLTAISAKEIEFFSETTIDSIDDESYKGDFLFDTTIITNLKDENPSENLSIELKTPGTVIFGKIDQNGNGSGNPKIQKDFVHTNGDTKFHGEITAIDKNLTCSKVIIEDAYINANNVDIKELSIFGTIEAANITIGTTEIIGNSDLKITEAATDGKVTLNGNISSTDSKNLTLNGNVEIQAFSIDLEQGILESNGTFTSKNDLNINATCTFTNTVNAVGDLSINGASTFYQSINVEKSITITGESVFKDAVKSGEDLTITGNANFENVEKTVEVGKDLFIKGNATFANNVISENNLTIEGSEINIDGSATAKNMNLSGQEITFLDKVAVTQNVQIQNTGLLKIADFIYGNSFVQKGSETEIGQVMILGSFEQNEQSSDAENPSANFSSNVYFYNSSQNLSEIVIGSDKSSTTISGNLIIAKSKDDKIEIKGNINSNNFVLYSGNVELSGNLSTEKDLIILGENYSLKDNQTGIENLYSYNENRPSHWSQASYNFETVLPDATQIPNYAGTVKVATDKSITVGKNLYANGTVLTLSGLQGSGNWKLIVPDTSIAANSFCEVYNSEVSDSVASCSESDKQIQIAALQCTDNSGNKNWAFDDEIGTVKITKAYSVSDNVIRVEFNKPVRILKDRFTQKQMRFSDGPDENHYFENVYLDEKCTTEASEVVNQYYEENGSKNYFVYVKANSKWNTDATGTFAGEENSTDYDANHQNTTICLDFPRAIATSTLSEQNLFSYVITDLWGKRLTNYSVRTTTGTQKTPFENVEDKTGPVLISVKTGQENHTEYDASNGADSQPSYDSHNFIEFRYSEFVNFGTENSDEPEEIFLKADDEEIKNAKNVQVTQKFGALQNEDITQSGELKFAGLAKIQNGKIYTGSQQNQGNADKFVNALYRFDKYSLRYSIAGYTHPTEFVQDAEGNNHKKWIGYIEEAEMPTGTVSMICDGENNLVFDNAGNFQTLVKNDLTVDSSKSGVYGNWDISKPIFAPARLNAKNPWQESEYVEAIGNNYGFGVTLDRVEFHLFDNTPLFDETDEAVWITERGWCKNDSSQSLILDDSYCADIFGGSRAFEVNEENRTSGGIRFSSLENAVNAFLYTTDTNSTSSEKFDVSKNVIVGTNARLFTGSSTTFREAKQIDGLYFSLPLSDSNLELKTTFKVSYDDNLGVITDLAGNRLKSKTVISVDRVSPSIEAVLSPIDNKTFYIIFTKKLNQTDIPLLDNNLNKIEISESFLELLPQCFELITINDDGTFVTTDIQIDSNITAEQVNIIENENYTAFKMAFTREVSFSDIKNVYLRVVNPQKYNYKMCDPITNIKDSYVTLIQDDLGNYIDMFQTHAISELAINGINPLYGYNSSIQEEKKPISNSTKDEVSFVVRDWNENQQNYGTFYHNEEITIVCDVDNASKTENNFVENVNLYFNNDSENKMTSEQFNKIIGGNLRIWFPNIMDDSFDFFTYKKNSNYQIISSSKVSKDDISAGLQFDFPKSVVENWKSGEQISFLFSYLNEDNSQVYFYPAPKFNLLTGLYELNNSMKFPLFAIRMKDVNDITSLDLWSFKVKSVTNQRGGVTILNNVINATYGEKAIVKINMPQDGNLDVMVMTLDGNIITYLNHGATTSGEHYFTWNGTNNAGSKVARGLYFVRVISSTIDETRKIMVVKD